VTFATNRSATAGPLAISSSSQPGYLHSALGTRPVRRDRPSRAQLSARFGDADGDDVPPAVIQGLLTTRSRRVGGHMHAPPPIAQEREKKIPESRGNRVRRTDTRAPARSARPSPAVTRVTRHASYSRASRTRCASEPTLRQCASVLAVKKRGTGRRYSLRARADSRDWRENWPPVAMFRRMRASQRAIRVASLESLETGLREGSEGAAGGRSIKFQGTLMQRTANQVVGRYLARRGTLRYRCVKSRRISENLNGGGV